MSYHSGVNGVGAGKYLAQATRLHKEHILVANEQAAQDYERAIFKGFWRKILTRIRGESNELLPFDDVRERLPVGGQHYLGLRQVRVDKIIGSMSRFRDFDRAFLPVQTKTKDRWISIDEAHYKDVILPPVDLYKMGEIYFVKDGNHRVSVARSLGMAFIEAKVWEYPGYETETVACGSRLYPERESIKACAAD